MAITVCGTCINFGSKLIKNDPAGLYITGRFDFKGCSTITQAQGVSTSYVVGRDPQDNCIQKFPFTSGSNANAIGDLACGGEGNAGFSSGTHGYSAGGYAPPFPNMHDAIEKFPFATDTNASDVGQMRCGMHKRGATMSPTHGYLAGGVSNNSDSCDHIGKFPFASEGAEADVGNLPRTQRDLTDGIMSTDCGYHHAGTDSSGDYRFKYPFASDTNASFTGEAIPAPLQTECAVGHSSPTDGFFSGGSKVSGPNPKKSCEIFKFPFASDTAVINSAYGNLLGQTDKPTGTSSDGAGFTTGGRSDAPPNANLDRITCFPFATDSNATDVAELACGSRGGAGAQV